ncbi:hypothetical protein L1987_43607 [Smallanthus sonchifolius]|uniref:Uncharacterized protein n=1 Tax=Smallanthus sonchifolius TaxID=185202 RepID=A0ACB9GLW3_9ASTR|nr:hypothetical protein L1987_43607 [Smallanthus sonchifolius]
MGDDDTVIFADNLVSVLSKYDHRQMYYVGGSSESVEQDVMHSYDRAFGGGGFAVVKILRRPDKVKPTVGRFVENKSTVVHKSSFVRPNVPKPTFVRPSKPAFVKLLVAKQDMRKHVGVGSDVGKPGFVQPGVRKQVGFTPAEVKPKVGFKDNSHVETKLSKPQRRRRN